MLSIAPGMRALVIAAAGGGSPVPVYPAACVNSLAVTAIQQSGAWRAGCYGDWGLRRAWLEIYAALPAIVTATSTASFATAYVSGLAALLFSMADDTNGNGFLNDEVPLAMVRLRRYSSRRHGSRRFNPPPSPPSRRIYFHRRFWSVIV
jgi:hypothetical protein